MAGKSEASSPEFPSDAELTPIPAPEFEDLELPGLSSGSEPTDAEVGAEEPDSDPVEAPALGNVPEVVESFSAKLESPEPELETELPSPSSSETTPETSDAEISDPEAPVPEIASPEIEVPEISGAGADLPPDAVPASADGETDGLLEAEAASAEAIPEDSPSQLEMPSLEQYEQGNPYGFEDPAPASRSSRSGLIPLLLLALIGVGAWQVADLVREEFARLEPDPEVVARVTLEDEAELDEAAFDSLLALGKQEDGPSVELDGQAAIAPASAIENVSWESVDGGGTRIVFAGNGSFSPMETRVTRLEGESPRLVLKIGGIQSPYSPDVLPVRTETVRQLRFGFHPLPLRNEVHAVLDLAAPEVQLVEAKFVAGRLEVLIQ